MLWETGNSLTVASFAQPPSQDLGVTAPSLKRNDGSSAPASNGSVGPCGGCAWATASEAAAMTLPAAATPSTPRRDNSDIGGSLAESHAMSPIARKAPGDGLAMPPTRPQAFRW